MHTQKNHSAIIGESSTGPERTTQYHNAERCVSLGGGTAGHVCRIRLHTQILLQPRVYQPESRHFRHVHG
jgi:hypothetical protein